MMPHSETPSSSPLSQENIPGFEGYKMMKEKVDVLKHGAFSQFMQKVSEYRSNPSKMESLRKEFAGYEKNRDIAALRAGGLLNDPIEGPARLFAFFGKEVNFEADGMRITFDFHGMNVAEGYVGAGHLLPGSVARIQNKNGHIAERLPGSRGSEYHFLKGRRYQAIYTNTEIFVHYRDIFPDSVDDLRERAGIEGRFIEQRARVRGETQKRLTESVPVVRPSTFPAGPAAPSVPASVSPRKTPTVSRSAPAASSEIAPERTGEKLFFTEKDRNNKFTQTAIDIHQGENDFLYFGSSSCVRFWSQRQKLRSTDSAGFYGRVGANPESFLQYLQSNWKQFPIRFKDGCQVVLAGMVQNTSAGNKSPKDFADTIFSQYERIANFLREKARQQGKTIRVTFFTSPPDPTKKPQQIAGVEAFNQKIREDRRYYSEYGDLDRYVTGNPKLMDSDGHHVKTSVLGKFAENFQKSV